ncbi:nucleoside triphosphate pyrophosphatase [Sediminibacterium sp. C3]|uniref:Maf family protein n=1 Tax=Sediminibacterium sp. C3 TaxID=1267211 RepID=UPI0004256507|nr:Maf family protein [Sediminibacterium sp. C3]
MQRPLILASQSPRRKQLLEWAEINFTVEVVETDESFSTEMDPVEIPIHIARAKAIAVKEKRRMEGRDFDIPVYLAADTVVVLNNEIINKPKERADAIAMLSRLSGQQHRVITGVVILNKQEEIAFSETTQVQFHSLSQAQIEHYVDQYKPYDKAGAYAIQEWIGVIGIAAINGDFYNVMGLPVSRVVKALPVL